MPIPRPAYFRGWNVVAAAFGMAACAFGVGFYGVSVYLAALQRLHGWSASAVSAPVTVYYISGAVLTASVGSLFERFGPRAVVTGGGIAMAAGVAALGVVAHTWQLYPVFLLMSVGWGAMSGAAINIIVAPWFQRRRGLAVSLAFNGAPVGGVVVVPAIVALIGALGFAPGLATAALGFAAAIALVAVPFRRGPHEVGLAPDGSPGPVVPPAPAPAGDRRWRRDAVRTWRFWSVSAPFALGLLAQIGVLTHLVALVTPALGVAGAAGAVSATTAAALLGRLATAFVVDRVSPRSAALATLLVQIAGLAVLASARSPAGVYAGCLCFGLGVGNLTTLPGLILALEWPRERFGALVGLVVGINQFTFAFGPWLVGLLRDWSGGYVAAIAACMAVQGIAAALVAIGPRRLLTEG